MALFVFSIIVQSEAIPWSSEETIALGADSITVGRITSYQDNGTHRDYEISIIKWIKNPQQDQTITMRSITPKVFDPHNPYSIFEKKDLGFFYLKYDNGKWRSTNYSRQIWANELSQTVYDVKKLVGNNNPDSSISLERVCKEGYVNAIKNRTGEIACVKPETKIKLIERGWSACSEPSDYFRGSPCGFHSSVNGGTPNSRSVMPSGDAFESLTVEGLNNTYKVGQKIEFTVKFNGIGFGCGYPELKIEDSEHQKVWESGNPVHSCDPDMKKDHIEKEWKIGGTSLGTPIMPKEGFYTLFVTFGDDIIQKDFWVKSHSDVEIIGLEDTYKVGDNVGFYVTVQGFGMIPCNDFTVSIKNDHGQTVLDIPAYNTSCQIPVEPENYEFYFPQKNDSYKLSVNQTGKYTVSAHFGDDSLEKEFVVKENNKIK